MIEGCGMVRLWGVDNCRLFVTDANRICTLSCWNCLFTILFSIHPANHAWSITCILGGKGNALQCCYVTHNKIGSPITESILSGEELAGGGSLAGLPWMMRTTTKVILHVRESSSERLWRQTVYRRPMREKRKLKIHLDENERANEVAVKWCPDVAEIACWVIRCKWADQEVVWDDTVGWGVIVPRWHKNASSTQTSRPPGLWTDR